MKLQTPPKTKKLVIFGAGEFAEVVYESFTHDSHYEVAGFAVEEAYYSKTELFGLPVVTIEEVTKHFSPDEHDVYVAVVFNKLNRLRTRLMQMAEQKGYALASYISSHAFVWPNVVMGKHCFIFEFCVVQPFAKIGDNVILWSGTHIGHHSTIGHHVFIARAIVAGCCNVGSHCFIGANATIGNDVTIGEDCFINMSAAVTKNLEGNKMYRGQPALAYRENSRQFFDIPEEK